MIREEGTDEDTCVTCGSTRAEIREDIKDLPGEAVLARDVNTITGDGSD